MVKLYVEGGGNGKVLRGKCRQAFAKFIEKAGISKKPRIVACGSRNNAYDSYRTAIKNGDKAILLVDSEAPIAIEHQKGEPRNWLPWQHLKTRDGWQNPANVAETDCHLMVQCMESWLLSDHNSLQEFFGQGFRTHALPPVTSPVEEIAKKDLFEYLDTSPLRKANSAPGLIFAPNSFVRKTLLYSQV